jgi:hypothetical protein
MTMTMLAAAVAILAAGALVFLVVRSWLRTRGTRLVTCPETWEPVGVEVDVGRAVITAAGGQAEFQVRDCTRWPEEKDCAQRCLRQIEAAPHDCLVREILRRWYEGKSCTFCGRSIALLHWHDHRPALKGLDDRIREWEEVPVTELPAMLATSRAVCWNCMVVEGFRREHPELVVERPRPPHPPRPHA